MKNFTTKTVRKLCIASFSLFLLLGCKSSFQKDKALRNVFSSEEIAQLEALTLFVESKVLPKKPQGLQAKYEELIQYEGIYWVVDSIRVSEELLAVGVENQALLNEFWTYTITTLGRSRLYPELENKSRTFLRPNFKGKYALMLDRMTLEDSTFFYIKKQMMEQGDWPQLYVLREMSFSHDIPNDSVWISKDFTKPAIRTFMAINFLEASLDNYYYQQLKHKYIPPERWNDNHLSLDEMGKRSGKP